MQNQIAVEFVGARRLVLRLQEHPGTTGATGRGRSRLATGTATGRGEGSEGGGGAGAGTEATVVAPMRRVGSTGPLKQESALVKHHRI